MQERVNKVTSLVCEAVGEVFGETPDTDTLFSVKKRNINRRVSAARQFTHYLLHKTFGYSITFIARMTQTTRTNVFSNIRKCRQLSEIYPDYATIRNKIDEKIKETQI